MESSVIASGKTHPQPPTQASARSIARSKPSTARHQFGQNTKWIGLRVTAALCHHLFFGTIPCRAGAAALAHVDGIRR